MAADCISVAGSGDIPSIGFAMSSPPQGLQPFARLMSSSLFKRLRQKPRPPEPKPELMPRLDAAKEAEIIQTINDLNRQVLSEIAKPERDH